jgi:hypothetical protein
LKAPSGEAFRVYDEHAFMSGAALRPAEPHGKPLRSCQPGGLEVLAGGGGCSGRAPALRAVAAVVAIGAGTASVLAALAAQRPGPSGAPPVHVFAGRAERAMSARGSARALRPTPAPRWSPARPAARTQHPVAGVRRSGRDRRHTAAARVVDRPAAAAKEASEAREATALAADAASAVAEQQTAGRGGYSRGEFGFER